jgi:CRP/FNR family transcriptional regulator
MANLRHRAIETNALDHDAVCKTCWAKTLSFCEPHHTESLRGFFDSATCLKVNPGTVFIHDGAKFPYYFNINRGATRSFKILPDGRRQILSFGFPGTLIGLSQYSNFEFNIEAINEVSLCRFSKDKVDYYSNKHPELRKSLMERMIYELSESYAHAVALGKMSARERLAYFLIKQNKADYKIYGQLNKVTLPMNRYDISDYLGVTTETISRTFTQFESEGLITFIKSSEIILRDRRRLATLAAGAIAASPAW